MEFMKVWQHEDDGIEVFHGILSECGLEVELEWAETGNRPTNLEGT